ncbi:MAG: hypothetical protein MZV63_36910 [Marinilabiliales bacterium]|nr:hypothetical protein [Marinilabiliales bacterium]
MKNEAISPVKWLPATAKEIELLGWDQPDVILFSGRRLRRSSFLWCCSYWQGN